MDEIQQKELEQRMAAEMTEGFERIGRKVDGLDRMLRKPTETRPFIYEVRFDLWPANSGMARVMLKGFGEESPLITFHDTSGLRSGIVDLHDRFHAGKVTFMEDTYPPNNYERRRTSWLNEEAYKASLRK